MKIPTTHIDLAELPNGGYPGYHIEMPRSVKEGYLHEFSKLSTVGADGEASTDSRDTNIKIMELVTAWNLDDDEGKVFPLISKVKTKAERERIIAEIPVDIIVYVAQRITGSLVIPEKTKDF